MSPDEIVIDDMVNFVQCYPSVSGLKNTSAPTGHPDIYVMSQEEVLTYHSIKSCLYDLTLLKVK
jgi:hypothetical protein